MPRRIDSPCGRPIQGPARATLSQDASARYLVSSRADHPFFRGLVQEPDHVRSPLASRPCAEVHLPLAPCSAANNWNPAPCWRQSARWAICTAWHFPPVGNFGANAKTPAATPPTVAKAAGANVNSAGNVTGTTAALSVLGSDAQGAVDPGLRLDDHQRARAAARPDSASTAPTRRRTIRSPSPRRAFTALLVTIVDGSGLSVTSSVKVTVAQTLTSISLYTGATKALVNPSTPLKVTGTSQTLAAVALDQFGNALAAQPSFTWAATSYPSGADAVVQPAAAARRPSPSPRPARTASPFRPGRQRAGLGLGHDPRRAQPTYYRRQPGRRHRGSPRHVGPIQPSASSMTSSTTRCRDHHAHLGRHRRAGRGRGPAIHDSAARRPPSSSRRPAPTCSPSRRPTSRREFRFEIDHRDRGPGALRHCTRASRSPSPAPASNCRRRRSSTSSASRSPRLAGLAWTATTLPSAASAPTFATSNATTTATFGMAGIYVLTAQPNGSTGLVHRDRDRQADAHQHSSSRPAPPASRPARRSNSRPGARPVPAGHGHAADVHLDRQRRHDQFGRPLHGPRHGRQL